MPVPTFPINNTARQQAAGEGADFVLLNVRLTPHRSLAKKQFRLLMVLFASLGTISSVPFVILGAWPVAGFMGIDVLLIYLAFRASYRSARAYEDISVTPLALIIAKVSAKGRKAEWTFHPAWVRLERIEHIEFGLQRLALSSRGRSVEVAGFLGPNAKAVFASKLSLALSQAKRGPRFS